MATIRHILAVLDPTSQQQPALDRAAWLARRSNASLELFVCDYDPGLGDAEHFDAVALAEARKALLDAHLRALKERAKALAKTGLTVGVDARLHHPLYESIAHKAMDARADLVVKDTHYHTGLRRSVFSNTDWQLIRSCPAPLWLVKPRALAAEPRIVAAVDPLHAHDKPARLDHEILAAATRVRAALGGELHVFHAYDVSPALAVTPDAMTIPLSLPVREIADSLKKRHTDSVLALTREYGLPADNVHIHEGETRQLLVALTEQLNADVVVIGAVSRSGLRRLFLGSTAEQVLDRLPCDVLIIKPSALPSDDAA